MKVYAIVADGKRVVKSYSTPGPAKSYMTRFKKGDYRDCRHLALYEIDLTGLTPIRTEGTLPTEQPPMMGQEPLFALLDSHRPIV